MQLHHVNTGDVGAMENPQNQNTAERKAAESLNVEEGTGMGETNGVIVPATTGMGARSTGQAG